MKIFVSYTSADRQWAHWIAWQLREARHEPFVHEWEIGAGENIPRWMEERIDQADHLIGVFSDAYCGAIFSRSERWAAYWDDPEGRIGFLIPIEVAKVTKWPRLVSPLNRLRLIDLNEPTAAERLKAFLEPRKAPTQKPDFPGSTPTAPSSSVFTMNSEPLGSHPPDFPAAFTSERQSVEIAIPIAPRVADLDLNIRCIDDHEPKPQIFGRDDEFQIVVNALLEGKAILVAGGPGMGKTAVATAALYDPRIIARFGRRRVFASLETAAEPRSILAKLIEALGLPPTGDEVSLFRMLEANAAEKPFAAILDNAETVFEADREAAERLLNLVTRIQGLSLVVTIRGVAPPIPGAIQIENLSKLAPDAARMAFLAIAGDFFRDDPNLPHILEALDGHALSIRLVAAQAIGSPSLEGIRESWDEAHAEILRRSGEKEGRLTSVRASLALSLNNKRMKSTPLARRLMALLAFLPGGLVEGDVRSLLGERGALIRAKANEAVVCLRQLQLVERRPDNRLRMLTPLRESVKVDVSPIADDQKRLIERYLLLAGKAAYIGWEDWETYRGSVEAEADNLDSICELAVGTNINHRFLAQALNGLTRLYITSGRGGIGSVDRAAARLRVRAPTILAALSISWLGQIAKARFDYEPARVYLSEALGLFRQLRDVGGEAECIFDLGDIARMNSDVETARVQLEHALRLCRRTNSIMKEANCIVALADIARARSDYEVARTLLAEASVLYRNSCVLLGEANCLVALGNIARLQFNLGNAHDILEQALAIYRSLGVVLGEANCIKELGIVEYMQSDHKQAVKRYEEALTLYRRIGASAEEAKVLIRLGVVQRTDTKTIQGIANINDGFALYFKIAHFEDRALPGWRAMHSSLTCSDENEAETFRAIARTTWTNIGRLDLVSDWIGSR